jgi:hypothetical protein
MNTEMYILKHQYIRSYLEEISRTIKSGITAQTAEQVANIVNKLNGVLLMHLASEDSFLYPELLSSKDEKTKQITRDYMTEMGNIAGKYTAFHSVYNTPSKIIDDVSGFCTQFSQLAAVLTTRMNREENELYKL